MEQREGIKLAVMSVDVTAQGIEENMQIILKVKGEMVMDVNTLRDHSLMLHGSLNMRSLEPIKSGEISYTIHGEGEMKGGYQKSY